MIELATSVDTVSTRSMGRELLTCTLPVLTLIAGAALILGVSNQIDTGTSRAVAEKIAEAASPPTWLIPVELRITSIQH